MGSICYKRASSEHELLQILKLQQANIPTSLSEGEKQSEGFVTVNHTLELLKKMNDHCAHTLAVSNGNVVGYALSMVRAFRENIEVLKPMFRNIDTNLPYKGSYVVMGQICIDKAYRKQGIFRGLYQFMKTQLKATYDMIITEVDVRNTRSMNAHYAIGFKTLYSYHSKGQDWKILYWNLN